MSYINTSSYVSKYGSRALAQRNSIAQQPDSTQPRDNTFVPKKKKTDIGSVISGLTIIALSALALYKGRNKIIPAVKGLANKINLKETLKNINIKESYNKIKTKVKIPDFSKGKEKASKIASSLTTGIKGIFEKGKGILSKKAK